jgi:hypothetical protein
MIVTPGPALAKIPCVIAVAYGVSKSAAVHAAISAGMVHGLAGGVSGSAADGPMPGGTASRRLVHRIGNTVCRPVAPFRAGLPE